MKEILELVLERNKERKLLTKKDVKRICELMIGINHYTNVQKIMFHKIDSEYEQCGGFFDGEKITFYTEGIESIIEEEYKNISYSKDMDGSKIDAYNFLYLTVIFHELAHVRQDKIVNEGKNTLETELFSISNKLLYLPHDFYIENYDNFPIEVNAFSKGSLDAFQVYKKIPKPDLTENDYYNYASYTLSQLTRFYDVDCIEEDVISPSERILVNADEYNLSKFEVSLMDFTKIVTEPNKESLYQKLMLGLPITFMDYAYINLLEMGLEDNQKIPFVKKLQKK